MNKTAATILGLSAIVLLSACADMAPMGPAMYTQDTLPDAVKVPAGHKVAMETLGVGEITYECRAKAAMAGEFEWVFVGPNAVLTDRGGLGTALVGDLAHAQGLHRDRKSVV